MKRIDITKYKSIVVLTGAGISVASGLRPFRGPGGIWEEVDVERYGSKAILETEPHAVWKLFGPLRTLLKTAQPNAAHLSLANLESNLKIHQLYTLITQNIDGLHQRAGSKNVIELHGTVGTSGSVAPASNFVRSADYAGARTILVNLEPMNPKNPYFKEEFLGPAQELLPQLL